MDFYGSPAQLGGIITSIAMGAWILGRWQSAVAPLGELRGPVPVAEHPPFEKPSRGTPQAGRKFELDCGLSLGELHAEVSAYRQQQQVFASVARDGLWTDQFIAAAPSDCGDAGRMAQPIGLLPVMAQCACWDCTVGAISSAPPEAMRVVQPSPAAPVLTRV